jgi:hypothetical protein
MKETYPIDFVIMWVDGNDPEWQKDCAKHYKDDKGIDASFSRVRDWDNLRYLFRSIETFAPWVRKIHFVTWGHKPEWLNVNAPKMNFVKHSDFLPKEYLPTFSSFPTSLNLHRIAGIAEHFVCFDDDMFLGYETNRTRFFRNQLPVETAQLTPIFPILPFAYYTLNSITLTHQRYNFLSNILHHSGKWFSPKLGLLTVLKNISLLPWANNVSFRNPHVPIPYLRSTYEKLWQEEFAVLDETCRSKFRKNSDVYAWLMRYEQLVTGKFTPHGIKDTHTDMISDARAAEIAEYIKKQKYRLFCINDSNDIQDFEKCKATINAAFDKILPNKSEFEL